MESISMANNSTVTADLSALSLEKCLPWLFHVVKNHWAATSKLVWVGDVRKMSIQVADPRSASSRREKTLNPRCEIRICFLVSALISFINLTIRSTSQWERTTGAWLLSSHCLILSHLDFKALTTCLFLLLCILCLVTERLPVWFQDFSWGGKSERIAFIQILNNCTVVPLSKAELLSGQQG